jgi:hypothetical protein
MYARNYLNCVFEDHVTIVKKSTYIWNVSHVFVRNQRGEFVQRPWIRVLFYFFPLVKRTQNQIVKCPTLTDFVVFFSLTFFFQTMYLMALWKTNMYMGNEPRLNCVMNYCIIYVACVWPGDWPVFTACKHHDPFKGVESPVNHKCKRDWATQSALRHNYASFRHAGRYYTASVVFYSVRHVSFGLSRHTSRLLSAKHDWFPWSLPTTQIKSRTITMIKSLDCIIFVDRTSRFVLPAR